MTETQLSLAGIESSPEVAHGKVTNVSQVPHRSPFRYPGGKTWLVPTARRWLRSIDPRPRLLIEPFAGGGIIGLTAAAEGIAESVLLIELDEDVAAVWKTCLSKDALWLARAIIDFDCNLDTVQHELSKKPRSTKQRAFQTILRNRTFHGGIMAPGSGLLKNGENGKGITSRWYPTTLRRRILDIYSMRDRVASVCDDGIEVIQQNSEDPQVAFFIDPPYTAAGKRAGKRLYRHNEIDHDLLFERTARVQGSVLMTYDDEPSIEQRALLSGFSVGRVAMQNTHLRTMNELVISKNLDWM